MTRVPYYRDDLAWVHHTGYAGYVANAQRGIVARLREHGLARQACWRARCSPRATR